MACNVRAIVGRDRTCTSGVSCTIIKVVSKTSVFIPCHQQVKNDNVFLLMSMCVIVHECVS